MNEWIAYRSKVENKKAEALAANGDPRTGKEGKK